MAGKLDDHFALFHRSVVFHFSVEHDRAGAVTHRLDHALRLLHIFGTRAEDTLGDIDLNRVKTPCTDTSEQVCIAELVFAGNDVLDVAEWTVEREDPVGDAGVDHARHCVVPQILLVRATWSVGVVGVRVLSHEIVGVTTADAGCLHATVRGEVRRAEREALHARGCRTNLFDVGDATRRLEERMNEDRSLEAGFRL